LRHHESGGAASVIIPPGAPVLSDAIDLKVSHFTEIAVSLYLPEKTSSSTVHFWGQHKTHISGTGDFSGKAEMPNATTNASWYWLADVELWAPDQTAATVTLGDLCPQLQTEIRRLRALLRKCLSYHVLYRETSRHQVAEKREE
jgi:hypothetical protein